MANDIVQEEILGELKTLNKYQSELLSLITIFALDEIEKRLSHIFRDSDEFLVYKLTNGENSTVKIAELVNVSSATISRLWQKWDEDFGIAETSGYRNPYKSKYSIVELTLLFGKSQDNGKE